MNRLALVSSALCVALVFPVEAATAQDAVRLSEIIAALEGTELGALEVAPAPLPGRVGLVRRSEVLAALRRAGRSADGLRIPRVSRIRREARTLDGDALVQLSEPAVREAMAPCSVSEVTVMGRATVAAGQVPVRAEGQVPRRSGTVSLMVVLGDEGRELRLPARARVQCPPPIIAPGARIRILARSGLVEARAPGVARQPGRVGDVIRVENTHSRRGLQARVVDANTVEVVR